MSFKFPSALAALVSTLLLASCGGGGGQIVPFVPTRVLAFGDELSVIEPDGRKYSINGFKQNIVNGVPVDDPTTLDCARYPIWIQTVAVNSGLAFGNCLGTATVSTGQVLARPGAKVADLASQLATLQGTALNDKDLVLVMIGMHDILELYARYPAVSSDVLLNEARVRGAALGSKVNEMALTGPAVVVMTTPDIGLTPYALAQNVSTGDATRSALISQISEAFNNRMSVELINDGRLIGLVFADIEVQNMAKFPGSFGLTNATAPACRADAPLPNCTSATLVDGATATTWLWADNLRLAPAAHSRLGAVADARARGNPF